MRQLKPIQIRQVSRLCSRSRWWLFGFSVSLFFFSLLSSLASELLVLLMPPLLSPPSSTMIAAVATPHPRARISATKAAASCSLRWERQRRQRRWHISNGVEAARGNEGALPGPSSRLSVAFAVVGPPQRSSSAPPHGLHRKQFGALRSPLPPHTPSRQPQCRRRRVSWRWAECQQWRAESGPSLVGRGRSKSGCKGSCVFFSQ
mmetsp:Transcript_4326/g.9183  ORF Transcript_4326/g.9183 Transcript_4326/m.9183 type:complete len:204 (-) Transcript_4326:19-630(-)